MKKKTVKKVSRKRVVKERNRKKSGSGKHSRHASRKSKSSKVKKLIRLSKTRKVRKSVKKKTRAKKRR